MATSARRQRLWALAGAQCIAVCKNTAWNEAAQLRTPDSTAGGGGRVTRLCHRADSAVDRRLLLSHDLDFGIAHCPAVAGLFVFGAPSRSVFLYIPIPFSCRHA